MLKRLAAVLSIVLAAVGVLVIPGSADNSSADNSKGDVWLANAAVTASGHDHEPHLDCTSIYLHGSELDASGTYTISSIPGTGHDVVILTGTWTTPASGDVITTFSGSAAVDAAIALDSATPNANQGYHFKLTLTQDSGPKYKTFWVRCGEAPAQPSLGVTKTADASPVVAGNDIGFTVTVGTASFADSVTLNDPLPIGDGLNWSVSPAYSGPGTCAIGGAPAQQTLVCTIGDLGGTPLVPSASIHLGSHTIAGTTAALDDVTFTNTATAGANDVDPVQSTARIVVTPAGGHLQIAKTADAASVVAGSVVGFAVTVTSSGPGIAHDVTVADPLPASGGGAWSISPAYAGPGSCSIGSQVLNCSLGNMASGASATVHMVATTPAGVAVSLTNVASASVDGGPAVTATAHTGTFVPDVAQLPTLQITKTADAATVSAGSQVGFTVTVRNPGPGSAVAAMLSDPLPGIGAASWSITPPYVAPGTCSITGSAPSQTLGCSLGDLAPGTTASVHVAGTSPATAVTITNTAAASAENYEPVTATAHTITTVPGQPLTPTLAITKVADSGTVIAGSQVGFRVSVANDGAGTATSASLNDPLPATGAGTWSISPAYSRPGACAITGASQPQTLTCSFGDLTAGATATVHVVASTAAGIATTLVNTATTVAGNNPAVSAGADVAVEMPAAVLGVSLTKNPSPAPSPSPTPSRSTSVLGLSITKPATGALPKTGGVPIELAYPAAFLLLTGGVLVIVGRRRKAIRGQ